MTKRISIASSPLLMKLKNPLMILRMIILSFLWTRTENMTLLVLFLGNSLRLWLLNVTLSMNTTLLRSKLNPTTHKPGAKTATPPMFEIGDQALYSLFFKGHIQLFKIAWNSYCGLLHPHWSDFPKVSFYLELPHKLYLDSFDPIHTHLASVL